MHLISRAETVWAGCLNASTNERGWSAKTLHSLYLAFTAPGGSWRVLVDRAKAGPNWQNHLSRSGLPDGFVDHLSSLWARNQRNKFKSAYTLLTAQYRRWAAGDPTAAIPGYGCCPLPDPDSLDDLPAGWSYSNLLQAAKSRSQDFTRKLIQIGPKAASNIGPMIPTTRVGLAPGSYYFLDDSWNDFKVAAYRQTCRLLSFHALDYPSGFNVQRGHKPALRDEETQLEARLKEREIIWLVVKLLTVDGYHPDGCTIACEKATATLRKREREILARTLGDKIKVFDGPSGGCTGIPGMFTGRSGGNPRWKAPLESWFNLLRNRTADLIDFPGQTGSNSRLNLPEGLAGTESDVKSLIKAAQLLPANTAEQLRLGLLPWHEAIFRLDAVIDLINRRVDHDLEGWRDSGYCIEEFRTNLLTWTPVSRLLEYEIPEREMAAAYLSSNPSSRRERPLSPREVFDAARPHLVKLPLAVAALLLDETPGEEVTVRNHQLSVNCPDLDPDAPVCFGFERRNGQGTVEPLRNGDKWMVRVNPLDARAAWLYTATGQFAGVVQYYGRAGRTDAKALQAAFARKHAQLGHLVDEARRLAAPITQAAIDRTANNQVLGAAPGSARALAQAAERKLAAYEPEAADLVAAATPAADDITEPDDFSANALL
jgi:hypothetical protein